MNQPDPRFADLGAPKPKNTVKWYRRKWVLITVGVFGSLMLIGALVPAEDDDKATATQAAGRVSKSV